MIFKSDCNRGDYLFWNRQERTVEITSETLFVDPTEIDFILDSSCIYIGHSKRNHHLIDWIVRDIRICQGIVVQAGSASCDPAEIAVFQFHEEKTFFVVDAGTEKMRESLRLHTT